ncbi:hypothetical protein [Streptomyces sp. NBC_01497]|uniref:hypothetical protein n=1 Tax=Streptomyces sp. NBC_01497 TaxID=2903885 RepID=UPI002E37F37A|nr:hypothetical protein [Streptomyces sp. NBC_01497]
MTTAGPVPAEADSTGATAGRPPAQDLRLHVAAVASVFSSALDGLRGLDFGETRPAASYTAGEESTDAAV